MARLWFCIASISLFTLHVAAADQCTFARDSIHYSFEPHVSADSLFFRVTLTFRGGPSGTMRLVLPSEWAGQAHLDHSVQRLRPVSRGVTIRDTKISTEKEVRFPANTIVSISYDLVKDWAGKLDGETRFRPDLSPFYFHLIGTSALVRPKIDDFQRVSLSLDFRALPEHWSLATSFGVTDRCQRFTGLMSRAMNLLIVGGDYRVHEVELGHARLVFAIRGGWAFSDDDWISAVTRITRFERSFWHDGDFPYFLVTLTPLDVEAGDEGGTLLTNSFMTHLSRRDTLSSLVLGLIAHETFHAWNPGKIGFPKGSDYPVSWFFEGFTRYYQWKMLLRSGIISYPEYVDSMNALLRNYAVGEGTDVSLADFIRRHTSDHEDLDQLDSRRGAVIALWLDARIRTRTKGKRSLDDLMRRLAAQNKAHEARVHLPMLLTNRRLFAMIQEYAGADNSDRLKSFVENGGIVPIPAQALGPCTTSITESQPKFELGFEPKSMDLKQAQGVSPGTPAYEAGLRNGQTLVGWSFYKGDASKPVKLTILEKGEKRIITFVPRGADLPVQQFKLDEDRFRTSEAACLP